MDIVPPEVPTQETDQATEKSKKIIRFSQPRPLSSGRGRAKHPTRKRTDSKADPKVDSAELKIKLENYRAIFNTSPKGGTTEKQAVAKIAALLKKLPADDPTKHEYLRIALDYHAGDDAEGLLFFTELLGLSDRIENVNERLSTYHVLMRSRYCNDATKEVIGAKMIAILEGV